MTTTEPRQLREYQREAVDAVLDRWGSECRSTAVVLPTGTGKPLRDDTEIPVPGGFTRMGDIRPGTYVFGVDGKPVKVLAVIPQGDIELMRVSFDDGAELFAGPGHLWTVQRKGRKPRTVTTAWLKSQPMKDGDGYCWRVPVAAPVQYTPRNLPLDPYLVGSLIANGGMTSGIPVLITPDQAVVSEISRRGVDVKPAYSQEGACIRWTFPGLSHAIARAGLRGKHSRDKHIPEAFKTSDESSRWDLIRGLMDGDGSSRGGGRRSVNYHTTSRLLADDVAELAWSLGVRATISRQDRGNHDKPTEYTVHMLPPVGVSLFTSHRRDRTETPRRAFTPRRSIVSIEPAGIGQATCITVDSPDGLFLAGRRYVVTHNSTVIAATAAASARLGLRVVMLAHRAELLDQMAASVAMVDPGLEPVGIVRASRDDSDAQIIAASLQTLTNRSRLARVGHRDVILWDEVHHGGADSWREVLEHFGTGARPFFCGFTATLRRDDGKALREIIDEVAYEKDLRWAIESGYLVRPHGLTVKIPTLDVGKAKVRAGDFANNELAEIMEAETSEVVKAIANNARDRRAIVFAASVRAAWDIAVELDGLGIRTGVITGAMTYDERQPVYEDFRSGEMQMLVTVQVLTEGADFPMCDAVVIARPTRSQNLYSQMVGRALRLFDGKEDALVLDLVGASRVLGLVTLSQLDAGTTSKTVDPDGNELPPSDDDPLDELPESAPKPRKKRLGPIETIGIDLLGSDHTDVLWLETRKGIPFIPAGDRFVFLWPDDMHGHHYRVGHITSKGRADGGWIEDRSWPVHTAKEIAEDWLIGQGIDPPNRRAAWRVGRSAPSEAQISFARNLGVETPEEMDKGRVSDEINIALASRRLDAARP